MSKTVDVTVHVTVDDNTAVMAVAQDMVTAMGKAKFQGGLPLVKEITGVSIALETVKVRP